MRLPEEEGVYAWVVYRTTHAQSFTSKFNTDINTLRGNKCKLLNQNQPFTFLSFLKFTHSLASLTHPSSTHPGGEEGYFRHLFTSNTLAGNTSPVVQKTLPGQMGYTLLSLQRVWMHCKKSSSACPVDLKHEYPDGISFRCPNWDETFSGPVKGYASFILNWRYLQNTSWVHDPIYIPYQLVMFTSMAIHFNP